MSAPAHSAGSKIWPSPRELSQAMQAGLENRHWPAIDARREVPPPPTLQRVAMEMVPYSNSLGHPAVARPGLIGKPIRFLRRAIKFLIRPWLELQTRFNHAVVRSVDAGQDQLQDHLNRLAQHLAHQQQLIVHLVDRLNEYGQTIAQVRQDHVDFAEVKQNSVESVAAVQALQEAFATSVRTIQETIHPLVESLDRRWEERFEQRLNYAQQVAVNRELSWQGDIAKAGLWFNPPINVRLLDNVPTVVSISERILEHIFVHMHLPAPPAKVLDLGCAESQTSLEMASLGFQVTGVDLRELPLSHPNLTKLVANLISMPLPDNSHDAAVLLSTIEHVGLNWYSQDSEDTTDFAAMDEIYRVLKPGGRLILTTPFGKAECNAFQRIYDYDRLHQLLRRFSDIRITYGYREEDTWLTTDDVHRVKDLSSVERTSAIAMVSAVKA